jgi:hypothetical protein
MSDGMKTLFWCVVWLLAALLGLAIVGCAPKIITPPAIIARADFAPIKRDIAIASTQAAATTQKTAAVVSMMNDHIADTQPTSAFVAIAKPLAVSADESAKLTYADIGPIGKDEFTVETQSNLVYAGQVANHTAAATNAQAAQTYMADAEHERNSIFGGKLGHWLSDALWIGGGIGVLFLVSQVLLSSFPGTGWINFLAILIHIVGNIVRVAWTLASTAVSWIWNELALWHVPWGQSALPTKQTPPPPAPPNAVITGPISTPPQSGGTVTTVGTQTVVIPPTTFRTTNPLSQTMPLLLAVGSTILTLSLAH